MPLACLVLLGGLTTRAHAQERAAKVTSQATDGVTPPITERISLVADRDDDDADDRADATTDVVTPAARVDALTLEGRFAGATLTPAKGHEHARLLSGGRVVAWGERVPAGAQVQGVSAGSVLLTVRWPDRRESGLAIDVHGVGMRDGQKRVVDLATERASLDRTPPARIDLEDVEQIVDDPDALRVVLSSPLGASLGTIAVESLAADGTSIDTLSPPFARAACDAGRADLACVASAPLRLVVDDVDRRHPLVSMRSLKAEVGGAIVVRDAKGKKLQAIRVAGPRHTSAGAIGRYRVTIRPIVMRLTPGGAPSVGGTDAGAIAAVRQELAVASATWGQCGLSFGVTSQLDVKLVNPPPAYLVALGDDLGLPATGGDVRLKIEGKAVAFTLKPGWSTRQAALELQRVALAAGFKAAVSENARISSGAAPSVDVLLRKADGQLANAELSSSTEKTMTVRVGAVDLSDGLQHFGDTDSVAGTLEERALVKAVDDGDPRTIEVIVVPFFGGGGRIGESFIGSDGSSMRNVVILDRAGVRARRTSLTLAHELGHVILDEPGHPDDYGVDTPTLLMDSDASDASPFGPRRITDEDCARAVRQSGPSARIPLLTEWKLAPMRYTR
ncbi:MAG: hypothetical protein KIT84_23910 [Labilithrix sp.]|nr:hypothetical protein [Labilithrix sp.]MCW5814095.1 hypothetical protein [Labilithrix sp.]